LPKKSHILTQPPKTRVLALGNQAIARGAIEAGISVAAAYPGTPSSEISDTLAELSNAYNYYFEYSTNEKVALEVVTAAAVSGVRAITAMKHVGLNVAADAFMSAVYIGVNGGLVIVSADDPSAHSSQNEQDNRYYALISGAPMLEPSTPQEAKNMIIKAFDLSEELQEPILFRTTTRLNHSRGVIELGEIRPQNQPSFKRNPRRYIPVPAIARKRHAIVLEKLAEARKISEDTEFNKIIEYDENNDYGVITSGVSYNYVQDAMIWLNEKLDTLKLGMTNPLPEDKISRFLESHKKVLIVEELEPYLETQIKRIAKERGIETEILGKFEGYLPRNLELSPDKVVVALARLLDKKAPIELEKINNTINKISKSIPVRPPVLCPGCPHRPVYHALKKVFGDDAVYPTDIGCYTLGIQDPLNIGDILLCMGSSLGTGAGFSITLKDKSVVSLIGDSTFFHAGLSGLVNAIYNRHKMILIVLDNHTTAMTGHQPNPGIKAKILPQSTKPVKIEDIAKAMGADYVKVVNAFAVRQITKALEEAKNVNGVSVIITRGACALVSAREKRKKGIPKIPFEIDYNKCTKCRVCIDEFGCPAIVWTDKPWIDPILCDGCGVCAQICPEYAIVRRR